MAARPKRGTKGAEGKVVRDKKLEPEKVEKAAAEVSGRGRRQASAATKAWASLIPRSRSNSQGRVEQEVKAKSKGKSGHTTPSNPAEKQTAKGKGGKDNKTPANSALEKGGKRKARPDNTDLATPTSSGLASDGREEEGVNKSEGEKRSGRRGRATPATTPKTDQNKKTQAAKTGKAVKEVDNKGGVESGHKTGRGKLSSKKADSQHPTKRKGGVETDQTEKSLTSVNTGGKKSGSVVTKIMEEAEAQKSGRKSATKARVGKLVESESKKSSKKSEQNTKKSDEMLPKIDSYFAKAPEKSLKSKTNASENPRKRKSEDDDSEDPTPAKKATQQLPQKSKKTPPKKSLAHRDILNLLDDFNDDDKEEEEKNSDEETEVSFKTGTSVTTSRSWNSSALQTSVPGKKLVVVQLPTPTQVPSFNYSHTIITFNLHSQISVFLKRRSLQKHTSPGLRVR